VEIVQQPGGRGNHFEERNLQIQAVKVQRLYLQVADQLLALIKAGSFRPGQSLPSERDLAQQFGVSRPTIREAMIAMEISGAVEVRSGSGVYVLKPAAGPLTLADDPGPFEILEARRLIEGEACALAAQRINKQQLGELVALLDEMQRENRQAESAEEADERFHCLIAQASGNSAMHATIVWLWDLRNKSEISTHFHQRIRAEGIKPIIADHRSILKALRKRDGSAAREAMHNHLQRVVEQLLEQE
jgi:GntR family transcriptional repressor for pyruvate dehydrogenase complex